MNAPPATILFPDQESAKGGLPLWNLVLPTIKSDKRPSPASEPPSWNQITFDRNEDEEIPGIGMDSDSDWGDADRWNSSYIPSDLARVCSIYISYF